MTNNNFPKELHTEIGIGTVVRDVYNLKKGQKGIIFQQGRKGSNVMLQDVFYIVFENDYVRLNSKEIIDILRPDINVYLKRLQDAKNRLRACVLDNAKNVTVDSAWDWTGAVMNVEHCQREFEISLSLAR